MCLRSLRTQRELRTALFKPLSQQLYYTPGRRKNLYFTAQYILVLHATYQQNKQSTERVCKIFLKKPLF